MKPGNHSGAGEISFRDLVKDCAEEPLLVASFNKAYHARLQAPINALLSDRWPHDVSAEEEQQIGYFILFIHEHIWRRLQRAQIQVSTHARQVSSPDQRAPQRID